MTAARVLREQHQFSFDAAAEPVLRVKPGAEIVIETLDCFSNRITSPEQVFHSDAELLAVIDAYNPVSAPVYVEGAQPGDVLAVAILSMRLGVVEPYAVSMVHRDAATVAGRPSTLLAESETKLCQLVDGHVIFPTSRGHVRHPIRPMIGAIGTAPAAGQVSSLHYAAGHGGNIDCPDMTTGSTVYLPVNVAGALFSLGDLHALMGDAEITGVALETHGDVTVQIDLLKKPRAAKAIRLDTTESIGSIGCASTDCLDANLAEAYDDLLHRLSEDFGMAPVDAFQLLGIAARVRVGQCVHRPGAGWTSLRVSVPRAVLPGGEMWHDAPASESLTIVRQEKD